MLNYFLIGFILKNWFCLLLLHSYKSIDLINWLVFPSLWSLSHRWLNNIHLNTKLLTCWYIIYINLFTKELHKHKTIKVITVYDCYYYYPNGMSRIHFTRMFSNVIGAKVGYPGHYPHPAPAVHKQIVTSFYLRF